jgi:hypothetical protein
VGKESVDYSAVTHHRNGFATVHSCQIVYSIGYTQTESFISFTIWDSIPRTS